jgi:radical SAM protein with 4Fe4S-binding SPASM domain
MLDSLKNNYRKLKENDAFGVLMHPKVVANYRLYQKEQAERPLVMKSHPVGVEIEMTNRCNLACIQCLRSLGLKPYKLGDMDFENYQKILAQFPYVMNLSLNGFGEPMMYKRFFDVVKYSRKERPWAKIGIYSNGMLINEEKAYQLMDCGLTELNISIDAAYPDTYKRVRRGGKLDVLHDNIRRLVRVKRETRARFPMIGMNFVMLNDNDGELVPFIEQAAEFGVDFVNCITYASYDWGFKNKRTADSYKRELDLAQKRMDELNVRCKSFPSEDLSWSDPSKPFHCQFFWGENFRVTYNGDITLGCCTPFKETYSYGNVLETPFEQIWNNEFYRKNREMTLKNIAPSKTCASCDAFCKSFFADRDENTLGFVPMNSLAATAGRS